MPPRLLTPSAGCKVSGGALLATTCPFVLVLVVVIVLDLLDFCSERESRFPVMILFRRSDAPSDLFYDSACCLRLRMIV